MTAAENGAPADGTDDVHHKIGLLTRQLHSALNELGYADQFRGTRATPGDPNALMNKSPGELDEALAGVVRASIADGAKAVIIGGGPLTASALRLQPQFDIPLVVPVIAAAQAAAAKVQEGK